LVRRSMPGARDEGHQRGVGGVLRGAPLRHPGDTAYSGFDALSRGSVAAVFDARPQIRFQTPRMATLTPIALSMRTRSIVLAGVGICALLAAWILSSPPMSAPDEAAHLIRAVSAAEGQWTGTPVQSPKVHDIETANTRSFTLPTDLAVIDAPPCFAFKAEVPASCRPIYRLGPTTEKTYVGTYYPLFYVPLGVAARIAGSVPNAIYAERVVSALFCAVFLLVAFALTCTSAWRRAAWFLAAGPLTFYVASSAATGV
jgi:uncharacterized membrane protein